LNFRADLLLLFLSALTLRITKARLRLLL